MDMPTHPQAHGSKQVCCVCHRRHSRPLLEVYANGNWHPICRTCLTDIGLEAVRTLSPGFPRPVVCIGQQAFL